MGQRRAGLNRVGFRRTASAASSSGAAFTINQGWRPTGWYLPGSNSNPFCVTAPNLPVSGVANIDGYLITASQLFLQAGTITDLAYYNGNLIGNAGGTQTTKVALYRPKSTAPWQPGALAYWNEYHNMGFNTFAITTGVGLSVSAGERIYVTWWSGNQNSGGNFVLTPPSSAYGVLGFAWDGVTNPNSVTQHPAIGYYQALAYAPGSPPDPHPTINDSTDLLLNTTISAIPTFAFRFTPS